MTRPSFYIATHQPPLVYECVCVRVTEHLCVFIERISSLNSVLSV